MHVHVGRKEKDKVGPVAVYVATTRGSACETRTKQNKPSKKQKRHQTSERRETDGQTDGQTNKTHARESSRSAGPFAGWALG